MERTLHRHRTKRGEQVTLSTVLRAIRAQRKLNTTYCPWIKLAGVWLEEAGFEAGERVRITVEDKRLIITPL
ncbi:SymE family type I addiction module toxin [Burkholderia pseudomultivorans]|uniref:SymE family type I addiction module toxin n=1 Tax=Burkholderia pseudomultivorans TaxID=1207504 RepID=UPI0009BDEC6D|nr:SymE family type I addiction module toxin [Burkholderia pseudomultivorans]